MDKERAKFVLQSFRPDGADAQDRDFAEALLMATSDRELGEWLMRERAFDSEFAEALARVNLSHGLRESVLLAMVQDGSESPGIDLEAEKRMKHALATIEVPAGLRERVIEAMERSVAVPKKIVWGKFGLPLAACAGIALAFILIRKDAPRSSDFVADIGAVPISAVQDSFVRVFESPMFSLDQMGGQHTELITYLKKNGLPCGDGILPPGLKNVKGLGCRELFVDGKKGSLICFDDVDGTVHLIIFMRADIKGKLPGIEHPQIEQTGDWAKAEWANDRYVFSLMGMRKKEKLAEFF